MRGREPWFGLVSAAGLGVMLVSEGLLDVLGLAVAVAPLIYAAVAVLRASRR